MPFAPTYFTFNPTNTAPADFAVVESYPGYQYQAQEIGGVYCETREVAGALWIVVNATYSSTMSAWLQVNSALPSNALKLIPGTNTPAQLFYSAALGGTLPPITWGAISGPVGKLVTQPSVPASGTPYTNTSLIDCTVFVNGGTLTGVSIGGNSVGWSTIPAQFNVRVPAGQSITLTYSSAPTWVWFGG